MQTEIRLPVGANEKLVCFNWASGVVFTIVGQKKIAAFNVDEAEDEGTWFWEKQLFNE